MEKLGCRNLEPGDSLTSKGDSILSEDRIRSRESRPHPSRNIERDLRGRKR